MQEFGFQIIFYCFAALTVFAALMVVTQNNPVRCVLFLVLSFFTSAVLWMLLSAEFLSLILVLVYVGAVMTLFLFVVMMLNIDLEALKTKSYRYLPLGLMVVALLASLLVLVVPKAYFQDAVEVRSIQSAPASKADETVLKEHPGLKETPAVQENRVIARSNTEALGNVLYTQYLLAFEMAAVILLVAIIAAITLVHRPPIRSKQQGVRKQLMTERNERVRLVRMKSEK